MAQLLLIRHGQTEWNVLGKYTGQTDIALTHRGQEQAEETATLLSGEKVEAVFSSDLSRAVDTAKPFSKLAEIPIQIDPRFREVDHGIWEGMHFEKIQKEFADLFNNRQANPYTVASPEGESAKDLIERVTPALEEIAAKYKQDDKVVVFCHGFIIACLKIHFRKGDWADVWSNLPENAEITRISL